jgi:CheY-like chemotaxis protein
LNARLLPQVDLSDHSVLVVDDDETTCDLMMTLLSQCGAVTDTRGPNAMSAARSGDHVVRSADCNLRIRP